MACNSAAVLIAAPVQEAACAGRTGRSTCPLTSMLASRVSTTRPTAPSRAHLRPRPPAPCLCVRSDRLTCTGERKIDRPSRVRAAV